MEDIVVRRLWNVANIEGTSRAGRKWMHNRWESFAAVQVVLLEFVDELVEDMKKDKLNVDVR